MKVKRSSYPNAKAQKSKYPKIKKSIKWLREYLPLAIMGQAKSMNIDNVKPGVYFATQRADDELLIISTDSPGTYYFTGKVIVGMGLLISFLQVYQDGDWPTFPILFIILGGFFFLYGYNLPKREVILDRMNGLFTYPGHMMDPPITILFKDAGVGLTSQGRSGILSLSAFHPSGFTAADITHYKPMETWNLFVWYMDKNRPLPPGTAFDPYRQKDYERRKKAGSPPPLYPSAIETPENPKDTAGEKLSDPNYNYYG